MDTHDKWQALMRSIRKAAHILNLDLTEKEWPEYQNWFVGVAVHKRLWDLVVLRRKGANA